MELTTNHAMNRDTSFSAPEPAEAPTNHVTSTAPPPLRILFTMKEVLQLTGLSKPTLKWWMQRGWVEPIFRSWGGRGRHHKFSAWQTVGLAVLAGALTRLSGVHTQVGRVGVVRAMEVLAGLSDERLLSEDQQDARLAETVAADVARASLTTNEELSDELCECVARVLVALNRKWPLLRKQKARGTAGA